MTDIQKLLFDRQDPAYQAFQSKLMPTVDPETVIGVRTPALRKLAKELAGTPARRSSSARCPTATMRRTTSTAC